MHSVSADVDAAHRPEGATSGDVVAPVLREDNTNADMHNMSGPAIE